MLFICPSVRLSELSFPVYHVIKLKLERNDLHNWASNTGNDLMFDGLFFHIFVETFVVACNNPENGCRQDCLSLFSCV